MTIDIMIVNKGPGEVHVLESTHGSAPALLQTLKAGQVANAHVYKGRLIAVSETLPENVEHYEERHDDEPTEVAPNGLPKAGDKFEG